MDQTTDQPMAQETARSKTKRRVLVWGGLILSMSLFYVGTFRGECWSMKTWQGEQYYIQYKSTQYAFGKAISTREWWEPGPPPVQPEYYVCDARVTWRGFGLLRRRTEYLN